MKIAKCEKVDLKSYNLAGSTNVYTIHVEVDDVNERASEMIDIITSKSWISQLSAIDRVAFEARAKRTINKLVNYIFSNVCDSVTENFGEYLVSISAQQALEGSLKHKRVPLAELIKEHVNGNPGFDFHTESHTNLIAFGEAKFSGKQTPYRKALTQIHQFILDSKDMAELIELGKFVSEIAATNAINGSKAFVSAFSINAAYPTKVFNNALTSKHVGLLLGHSELYLIGVEVKC